MLRPPDHVAVNDCAVCAVAAVTGLPSALVLGSLRLRDPFCCAPNRGVHVSTYVRYLQDTGLPVRELGSRAFFPRGSAAVPLHVFLARLHGRRAVIVIRWPHTEDTHAIAAEGFMLCDNMNPRPQWYGSWLDCGPFKRMPTVQHAVILEEDTP